VSVPFVLRLLLTAAAYFGAAKLGLSVASLAEQVTLVWPPTGLALAAVVILGPRIWPGIALGAFLANATANEPVLTAAGIAAGNTLEAIAGAWILRRVGFRPTLDRLRDVLVLFGVALGSTIVSATVGVISLGLGAVQPWTHFRALWFAWWIGDAMGDLVVAPLLLVWTSTDAARERQRLLEGLALLATAAFVGLVVFAGTPDMGTSAYPLHYASFTIVVWGALRFGQLGTTSVTFVLSAIAIGSTAAGLGPFALTAAHESLLLLQFFLAVVAATGLLLGAAIAERDTAEQRRAAGYAALELSAERLALALDAGRMGVWDWDLRTGAVHWSENLEPMLGLARGGFEGTLAGFLALVDADDRARVDDAIQRALAPDGAGYDVEFRILRPDGTMQWMAAKGVVFHDDGGTPVRMLGVAMDVTARRRLEEELRDRAAELADADRRKDEFLAMLAHELRNPLTPLSTSLRLLRLDGAGRERAIDIAERQVKHLVRLVDDLLDVSRITRGKITLRRDPVLLGDVVERALELSRPLLDGRQHILETSLPPEPIRLEGDAVRLVQVFANLLDNAAKYTPTGGTVRLTAELVGGEVVVRVRDSGIGLSPELVPRIFDLFVQGDSSLARTHGGLGIGLTIVRRLVERHGGRVEARSAGAGNGSEFLVWLPAATGVPGETLPPGDAGRRMRPLRILIIEDNEDAAVGLSTMLELLGHAVRFALDGPQALALAETFDPEVVISDLGLPGMDGYELARALRNRPGRTPVLLIALSGYARDEERARALDAGFDHHLVKPPDFDNLLALLARVADAPAASPSRTLQ
jgi:PAS domain S-box-containing protein